MRAFRTKIVSATDFFEASGNPVRKRKVYKMKVMIQNSAIKCYHEFHVLLHKDLEILTLTTPFLLLTRYLYSGPM